MLVTKRVGVGLTWSTRNCMIPSYFQFRKQVDIVRMVMSPLWRGPGNNHGFLLDGKTYSAGLTTAQTPNLTRCFRCANNNLDLMRMSIVFLVEYSDARFEQLSARRHIQTTKTALFRQIKHLNFVAFSAQRSG